MEASKVGRAEVGERLGYVVVAWDGDKRENRVDTYSGFGGDIYLTLAEAEEILFVTRAEGELHRPHERYVVAEVRTCLTSGDSGALPDSPVAPPEEEK